MDAVNYSLAAVLAGVICTWVALLRSMLESFRRAPHLDGFAGGGAGGAAGAARAPRVSVILPARNEEGFIAGCLDSLLDQDYGNYEIVAIDDSSEDGTGGIIRGYAEGDSRVIHVSAGEKPPGWMGKNWACAEGYRRSSGELLLFTDSDTKHAPEVISLAVGHLQSLGLDALTAIPRILSLDFWTRVTLPMISTFLHTRFSAIRVNDPSKKTGYFFGSFFIIRREAYEAVGTHEGVRGEIIEDGALGRKVKESGHRMRMVRGDRVIDAAWARDGPTLWNALKRLMIPLYLQSRKTAVGAFLAVAFLLLAPFPALGYALALPGGWASSAVLAAAAAGAAAAVYAGAIAECALGLRIRLRYAALCPLGCLVVVCGFLSGLAHAGGDATVSWRGRTYAMRDRAQSAVNV